MRSHDAILDQLLKLVLSQNLKFEKSMCFTENFSIRLESEE
jgi:hypothetical protein